MHHSRLPPALLDSRLTPVEPTQPSCRCGRRADSMRNGLLGFCNKVPNQILTHGHMANMNSLSHRGLSRTLSCTGLIHFLTQLPPRNEKLSNSATSSGG